jgi:excisionase family DNA binding protein
MEETFYTVKEVADKLRLTPKGVYDLMKAGKLRYVQIGVRRRRISESALREFVQARERGIDRGSYTSDDIRTPGHAARTLATA